MIPVHTNKSSAPGRTKRMVQLPPPAGKCGHKIKLSLTMNLIKSLLFLFLLLISLSTNAQNLIADPGFEIHNDTCSNNWPGLTYWYNPNTATPDLTCTPEGHCNQILTPEFIESTQYPLPYDGDCMIGLYCCDSELSSFQTREYIATKFVEPLIAGEEYQLSFYISRAIRWNLAIDKVGAYFSVDSILVDSQTIMDVEPQVETSGEVLTPDLEWQLITLTYTATGGEQHMVLGNFRDLNEMTVVNTGTSWKNWDNAYYFVDEVSLQPSLSVGIQDESGILLKGKPKGNQLYLTSNVSSEYQIFDVLGRPMLQGQMPPGKRFESLERLAAGVYILTMQSENHIYTRKFWKE